jgi:hypothetical protein
LVLFLAGKSATIPSRLMPVECKAQHAFAKAVDASVSNLVVHKEISAFFL